MLPRKGQHLFNKETFVVYMDNLKFTISCEYIPHHSWMSFASWYSLSKFFPDAEVSISIKRSIPTRDLFHWTDKCKVKRIFHSNIIKEDSEINFNKEIVLSPSIMAVRDYDENFIGPNSSKSETQSTFIDYSEGCGRFVLSRWINKYETKTPFLGATRQFGTDNLTVNEVAVLRLWEKMYSLHDEIGI